MALGGAAVNVALRARNDGLHADFWIWNRDGQASSDARMPEALRVDVPGSLLGPDAEVRLQEWIREVLKDLPPHHRVAVVAGLGGRSGSALFPVMVWTLAERGLCVGAYCTFPAAFEGEKRRLTAEQTLAAVSATGALPRIVRLDDVLRSSGRGTSFKQFLMEADGRLTRPLRRFLTAR
jgi:cell division GTPase FtsZ